MKIVDILAKDAIIADASVGSKKQLLETLATLAAQKTGLDERLILDALTERERLGTTGIGRGVALPHTRLSGLDAIFCAFLKTDPIDFDAVDGKPVDLVFLLLVPEQAGADHLKALARLSRLLRDDATAAELRRTTSVKALYDLISERDGDDV